MTAQIIKFPVPAAPDWLKAVLASIPPSQHCVGCGWRPFTAHWTDPQCPRCGSKVQP